jgi:superfamily II DNA or RNA helicase/very-short-patch-repair endonuclease
MFVTLQSPSKQKVALFRSLFHGRDDVYPRRFESRSTGRSGYAPACGNEWVRGVCEKPRVACAVCAHRRFLPVTDEIIHRHLLGEDQEGRDFVIGCYPMLLDETCFFLAMDFDGPDWSLDAAAVMDTCRRLDLPAALERSRSGEGAHIWLFFSEALPAVLARKLGAHVLTETMDHRPDIGMKSYDRLFPNQDTLPKGGFGNLIALPLQGRARKAGNTLFLDEHLVPYADPWAFLSSLPRMSRSEVESVVNAAERSGRITGVRMVLPEEETADPWTLPPSRRHVDRALPGPLPKGLELVLADQIYIEKAALSPALRNRLIRLAAFQNPEFYRAQAMRLSTYDKPRIVSCAEDHPGHLALPRGCLDDMRALLDGLGVHPVVRDERCAGVPLELVFRGRLRPEQEIAGRAMLAHDTGVLAATTAFGKTVLAAWLIAQRGVNTLILVHRQQLLEQWLVRLAEFLDAPEGALGRLGGGRKRLTGKIDVALIQSLVRKDVVDDRVAEYGHLVVDECHHLSAPSFERLARRARAKFVTGLSATVTRKDGHHPIIFMQCGPIRHRVDARQQAAARPFTHHMIVRPTGFLAAKESAPDARREYVELCAEIAASPERNRMICADVVAAVREGRHPIVLTERTAHLHALADLLEAEIPLVIRLQGNMKKKEQAAAMEKLTAAASGQPRVLVATGRFIGEGFDEASLDTLFLAMPVSWRGTIAQYAGRLHRLCDGKKEVRILDYADLDVPMLSRMFDKRCRGYEAIGYTILVPASALPGWPVDVPLPVDPVWKQEYAASVRRLIRDGVDTPLAQLFVHVARPPAAGTEGAARARSASEAFLYRRLQSLAETRDLFRLNVSLPIAFDGWSSLEVGFYSARLRLALEVDGDQHLGDRDAWRRDRRKDALLQENGCMVLRFLAEDFGRDLDRVLDAILRAVAFRRRARESAGSSTPPPQVPVWP